MSEFYRRKPIIVEARQYNDGLGGGNRVQLSQWCGGRWTARWRPSATPGVDKAVTVVVVPTLEGDRDADPGDWIIKSDQGAFDVCDPVTFDAVYEAA